MLGKWFEMETHFSNVSLDMAIDVCPYFKIALFSQSELQQHF